MALYILPVRLNTKSVTHVTQSAICTIWPPPSLLSVQFVSAVCTVVRTVQLTVWTVVHLYRRQSVQMADRKDRTLSRLYTRLTVQLDNSADAPLYRPTVQADDCTDWQLYRQWLYRRTTVQTDNCTDRWLYKRRTVQKINNTVCTRR